MEVTGAAWEPRPAAIRRILAELVLPWAARKVDVVSLGYPKTGNTWFSMLCRKLIVDHYSLPDGRIGDVLPSSIRALVKMRKQAAPIIFVTHHMPWYTDVRGADLRLSLSAFRHKKAVFLVRDPKDTLVSLYMHAKHREGWYQKDLESFIFNDYFGIEKYLAYYSQLQKAENTFDQVHIVRYEDLSQDTGGALAGIAEFSGLQGVRRQTIDATVRFCSIENMRKMELDGISGWWAMKSPRNKQDRNAFKARQGRVGGFAEHLRRPIIEEIDALVKERMPKVFGYGGE